MMRTIRVLALAASGLALGIAGAAAQTGSPLTPAAPAAPPAATGPATPAAAADAGAPARAAEVAPSGRPITLEAGQGTLIRLSRPASTVFIANPAVADVQVKSPQLIYLTAKAQGDTALYAVDAEDHVLLNAPVRVEPSLAPLRRLQQSLHALAPGDNVKASSVDNALVLSGKVPSASDAERLRGLAAAIAGENKGSVVNRLSVATPNQVNIRVKVAEVDRNVLKSLGINWSKLAGNIQFATDNPITSGQIINANLLQLGIGGHNGRMLATIDALAQEGLLTTLAEPNLTATNGQPASFLAGGEFPVPVSGSAQNGVATITVEFKKFGVSLDATPTILDADHLSLRIRTGVSQLSTNGQVSVPIGTNQTVTIPALTERTAETTVELGSGQSFVLGGLLERTTTQAVSQIPWLGDLPIIGQLFRSEQFQSGETELVIIVTPYLVKPTATALAKPTDGFVAPHDAQRIIEGDTHRQTLPGVPQGPLGAGGQGLVGPVGFRLD